jgi:DNA polymerase-3 subunit epsilon
MTQANTLIVLDFETTGLSPDMGDRAIEIGAVKIENGELTERFQRLMNPGRRISSFIENYTGITNTMLKDAPSCAEAMSEFADFIGDYNLLAHNASFDKRFLDAELDRINRNYGGEFACSLLVARRVFPEATNHQLGTLVNYCDIESTGEFHRALYDSEMTAKLWLSILNDIEERHDLHPLPFSTIKKLSKTPKKNVETFLGKMSAKQND